MRKTHYDMRKTPYGMRKTPYGMRKTPTVDIEESSQAHVILSASTRHQISLDTRGRQTDYIMCLGTIAEH
eukprot:1191913-Prorocentrum_minimum.AAC.2